MPTIPVNPDDPRLTPFTQLQSRESSSLVVIEGEFAVQRALRSSFPVRCAVATPTVAQRLAQTEPDLPVYQMTAAHLRALTGFAFHRGCLACAPRPERTSAPPQPGAVVAVGVCDPHNLGAVIRNLRALGGPGLWLGPRCADPWSRRATRASMGHNFSLPLYDLPEVNGVFEELQARGIASIAAALGPQSSPLPAFEAPAAWTLWVGNEGHGLADELVQRCSHCVEIPMLAGADSVNVATATGILLYALRWTATGS